ncbi:uncharacterized protein EMH_0035710 [Eimeria mitis]|uniref:Glycosyl transferase 48 domain-containing protein n=1 Tax=Eimeria mitis TaxID=44415 RepID=U6JR19_9EIME|nr:uncharacterized protein EMH_0035710 [Eimeria mitis]CDJ27874.1 hypothetical protein EMH_0035710 [Eimeria mitis]
MHRRAESRQYIRTTILEGTRELLKKGFITPETKEPAFGSPKANEIGPSAPPATPEIQAKSSPCLPSRFPSKGAGAMGAKGGAGDFESKIARAIHWLRQKKECDRSLFAARTKSAFRYTVSPHEGTGELDSKSHLTRSHPEATGGQKRTFLSMLCQGLPHGPDPNQMEAPARAVSSFKRTDRSDTLVESSGDSGSAENSCAKGLQAEILLSQTPLHSASPRFPLIHRQTTGYARAASGEDVDCEYPSNPPPQLNTLDSSRSHFQWRTDSARLPSYAPGNFPNSVPTPTLLEAQFARDLARDCMAPMTPVGCAGQPQTGAGSFGSCSFEKKKTSCSGELSGRARQYTTRPTMRARHCMLDSSSPTDALGAECTSALRRHSIITLHPRHESSLPWSALATMDVHRLEHLLDSAAWPEDSVVASNQDAINAYNHTKVGIGMHPPVQALQLHRHEAFHRTEFQISPHALETSGAVSRQDNHDRQANSGSKRDKHEARTSSPRTAAHRSNSVGALREIGILTMKERVAFFEEKLSRHQARMEAEAQNLARLRRNTNQEEMLWPSRRGPLRLEAIYKIRLPLIVDESGTPWGRAPIIGPGKPENQNHAIAFSRMDTMQVMDMNMESYLEEAIKLRNLLQEFALNARMRILEYNYSGPIESALEYVLTPSTYVQFQLGMLLVLPLIPWLFLEKGLGSALRKLVDLISKFSVTYYNFMTCTKASVIDHVLIYGGAKYQETGRGFVIERATLKDIWMFFYFTHFSIGLELFVLLIIYATYAGLDAGVFFLDTWPILLMAASINFVPFIFNPLGFYYPRLRQDFTSWNAWLSSQELGMPKESWVSWWRGEMEQRCNIVWHHKVIIVLRLLRFPLLAAGITSCVATSIQSADVDCAIYLVAASGLFAAIKTLLGDLQMLSPSVKAWLSLLLVTGTTALVFWLVVTKKVSLASIIVSLFALCLFIYGAVEIAFALLDRWAVRSEMLSDVVRMYHRCAGFCTFAPLLVLSAITTSVHHLQTRILFNPTFVSIVKSGLVQREQVEKSGRGHS